MFGIMTFHIHKYFGCAGHGMLSDTLRMGGRLLIAISFGLMPLNHDQLLFPTSALEALTCEETSVPNGEGVTEERR